MRFNSLGEALTGLGKRWLTDTRQIFQAGSDDTGWNLVDQFGVRIADGGATLLAAGGGKWASSLQTTPIQSRSNFGYTSNRGWIWDIALDGTAIVECPDYQVGNQVGLLGGPYVSGNGIFDARAFSGGFVASVGNRPFSSTHGWIETPAGLTVFTVCQLGTLLLYTTHAWLVLQVIGTPRGRVIAPAPAFYPDMIAMGPGVVRVGYTLTQGDTELRMLDVSIDTLTENLAGLRDAPATVPAPPPQPILTPEPPPVAAVPDRSVFTAHFLTPRLLRFEGNEEETCKHTFDLVNALCIELRRQDTCWGLLAKPTGPRGRSADVLLYKLSETQARVIDVVVDSEGHGGIPKPFWALKDIRTMAEWREPFPVGIQPDVSRPPLVPPPATSPAFDPTRVALVETRVTALQKMLAEQQQAIEELKARVNAASELPKRVALKGSHGHYITAEDNQSVTNRTGSRGEWEIFELEPVS